MPNLISLIVCTLGRSDPLVRLLDSLQKQRNGAFETIIVDQNPHDEVATIVSRFEDGLRISHVRSAKGLSRARNVGIGLAGGDVIGFPDDDCWYDDDVTERVARFFDGSEAGLLTGRTIDETGVESVSHYRAESGPINRYNVFASGNSSSLFARRAAVASVGGFDETLGVGASSPFQSGEETDFILRCLRAGYPAHYDRDFIVRHDRATDSAQTHITRARMYSGGFGRLMRLHDYGAAYFGARIGRALLRGGVCLATGDLNGARQRYGWAMGSLRGYMAERR